MFEPVQFERQYPLKWKKYLKLVEYGLIDKVELANQVVRFNANDTAGMLRYLTGRLERDAINDWRNLYVVILVPPDQQGQLPNFRLERTTELEGLLTFLQEGVTSRYTEVWCCNTPMDLSLRSVAGRILFAQGRDEILQVIEQIWRCSPRLIETFDANFPYPYIRGAREGWARRYFVSHIHSREGINIDGLVADFRESVIIIERARERIECFCDYLESKGMKDYSLEYKIVGGKLSVIDWDTTDDRKVIA